MTLLYACDACGCEAFRIAIVDAVNEVRCRDCGNRLGQIGQMLERPLKRGLPSSLTQLAERVSHFAYARNQRTGPAGGTSG